MRSWDLPETSGTTFSAFTVVLPSWVSDFTAGCPGCDCQPELRDGSFGLLFY